MKKKLVSFAVFVLIFSLCLCTVYALPAEAVVSRERIDTEDGYYIVTVTQYGSARSNVAKGSKKADFYDGNGLAWTLVVTGSFIYDGSTAKAVSAASSYTIHNSAWSCTENYGLCSGASATAYATFVKGGVTRNASVTLTCSPDGRLY